MSDFSEGHDLGKLQGKREEQQRIIELLEAKREKHIPWCGTAYCIECEQTIGIEKAIALIKGENMAAIRADRNSDIAQQEYADFSNPLIKDESQMYNETVIHLTEGHNGGEHSACCNDWGCYGCENCEEGDCDDCSEGENDGS